ncbi:MAG: class I SAM-dependent methyltransferase [Chloroflexota bacterium]
MDQTDRQSPQSWNNWYLKTQQNRTYQGTTLWLKEWLSCLEPWRGQHILELGCGTGIDTQYLSEQGHRIIATDYAEEGLKVVQRFVPQASTIQLDLAQALPFAPNTFSIVIASLSLHYFSWVRTQALIQEIHTCLRSEGLLLTRFNSTNDINHGANEGQQIEPGYFLVRGRRKRFFTDKDVRQLFQPDPPNPWHILQLQEKNVHRFDRPKVVWESIVQKQ